MIGLQKKRNEHLCTSSSSWDPKEAEHLHAARYLNYATNTVVKSAKLVPTLIISVGEPRGKLRAWLGCFNRGKWGEGQVSFGSS